MMMMMMMMMATMTTMMMILDEKGDIDVDYNVMIMMTLVDYKMASQLFLGELI